MTTRVVTATYKLADGTARKGYLTFTPSCELQNATDGTLVTIDPVKAVMDVTGKISVTLLCTDSPSVTPADWYYIVAEYPDYWRNDFVVTHRLKVPYAATPLDLASVVWAL